MAENTNVSKFANIRRNFARFFKEIRTELKKVIWPTREQLFNNTITVLLTCLIVGLIIWIADFGLTKLVDWALAR